MKKTNVNQIFKRALQGESFKAHARENPATSVLQDSEFIEKLDTLIEALEEFNGDYAHELMYGADTSSQSLYSMEDEDPDSIPDDLNTRLEEIGLRSTPDYDNDTDDDAYTPDSDEDLDNLRLQFFYILEEAASRLNTSATQICAAFDIDHEDLYRQYLDSVENFNDADLVHITSQVHHELSALKEALLNGQRLTETRISDHLENEPLSNYREISDSIHLNYT